MRLQLDLDIHSQVVGPGATVTGSVLVLEGGAARSLTTSLEFHEDSNSGGNRVVNSISTEPLHEGELEAGMQFPFTLKLPVDALPNYRSDNGELYWEVHARLDELGFDTHVRKRAIVQVARRGRPPLDEGGGREAPPPRSAPASFGDPVDPRHHGRREAAKFRPADSYERGGASRRDCLLRPLAANSRELCSAPIGGDTVRVSCLTA